MKRAAAALAGAGFGLFAAALTRAVTAWFWPLATLEVLLGALVAGGLAALAAALAPAAWRERLRRRRGLLGLAAAGAAAAAVAATGGVAERLDPAAGLGLLSFPALYLAALAAPFAAGGIALTTWCDAGGRGIRGWFLAGIGAGALGASLLASTPGAAHSPWTGGRLFEFSGDVSGGAQLAIDRGLQVLPVAAGEAELAFPPTARGMPADVLVVGLANGSALAGLVGEPQARITILEEDAALVRAVLARWPELARARSEGRVAIVGGAGRWALAGPGRRFDLVVLGESWSAAAYRSRTLSHRRDYRWTVEAFAGYLSRLKPTGRLLVRRNGIARALLTLREAAGLPAAEFARRIVVLERGNGVATECWYSAAGFDGRESLRALRLQRQRRGVRPLYTPLDPPAARNFYTPLIRGELPRGLAFSTPLDLSPPLDARPFFDHAERLMLSLRLRGMPEELEPLTGGWGLRLLLAADRRLWGVLFAGLVLAAGVVALGRRGARAGGSVPAPGRWIPVEAVWRGVAAGLLILSFAVWAGWLAPSPLAAAAAQAALLGGVGAGWASRPRPGSRWSGRAPAAALALLFAAAGYRLLDPAVAAGPVPAAAAMIAVGALLGAALGVALGAGPGEADEPAAGAEAARCGVVLAAASLAAVAATLAATHFGYPLLWLLGAVALLAPGLGRRSGAPPAAGPAT